MSPSVGRLTLFTMVGNDDVQDICKDYSSPLDVMTA